MILEIKTDMTKCWEFKLKLDPKKLKRLGFKLNWRKEIAIKTFVYSDYWKRY